MSEQEYNKLRRQLRYLTVTVVVFMLLAIASLVHTFINPKTTSFPRVQVVNGKNGKDATVDYNAINQYIQAQIAVIPKPQNGVNGQNGTNGQQGAQGTPGVGIQGLTGQPGADGATGAQGDPGATSPSIELRYNPAKLQTEWRYVGDLTWRPLFQNCQILGTC